MSKILFVVESAGKTSKISGWLGSKYIVRACAGIFKDLPDKPISIDFDNNFEPKYVITNPGIVKKLKTAMQSCSELYVASDNDSEGHGIAQSLVDTLKPKKYVRILFNEITKKAILDGIKNGGDIDPNLICAQKTRRVIDRLYGYMVSPIITKKTAGRSAGRTQSVALRIIVERENEIKNFMEKNSDSSSFKVTGKISGLKVNLHSLKINPESEEMYKGKPTRISLSEGKDPNKDANKFLNLCLKSKFTVHSVTDKPATRSPPPPFTTSSLQQENFRKNRMSIDLTMKIAQQLYEGSFITYMRTDSITISEDAHKEIKKVIEEQYGEKYYKRNQFKNKNKSAQLAHEAIRVTDPQLLSLEEETDDELQIKLYRLIWDRTIASQMAPCELNITTIQIDISKCMNNTPFYYFQSQIEVITFLGFMKVYTESVDDEVENDAMTNFKGKVPKENAKLDMEEIIAKQEFERPAVRYTQASLVKKLEDIKVGRPSTYVSTVTRILNRKYVEVGNIPGIKKDITILKITSESDEIEEKKDTILLGKETKKMIPTELGNTVHNYMVDNFEILIDYNFTAELEKNMDRVAKGKKVWQDIVKEFYDGLNILIKKIGPITSSLYSESCRKLGVDNENEIIAVKTKYGPSVARIIDDKPYYANLTKGMKLDKITLKEAVKLLNDSVIVLGQYEGSDVVVRKNTKTNTHYITYGVKKYCPIADDIDHTALKLKHAIKLITTNEEKFNANVILEFTINGGKVLVLKGKGNYSPYIHVSSTKKNYPIHKSIDPETLTKKKVTEIISTKYKKPQKKKVNKK